MISGVLNLLTPKTSSLDGVEDLILSHYRQVSPKQLNPLREIDGEALSSVCLGLGDTMMLTDVPAAASKLQRKIAVFSPSPHFLPLMSFNPDYADTEAKGFMVNAPDLIRFYDCGNGHYLQRLRRAFRLPVADKPHGFLRWSGKRNARRVILHFDPGVHVRWQRKMVHPRARQLYPETKASLEAFIASKAGWEFIQVGDNAIPIRGAVHKRTANTTELVNLIAGAEWFIGIMSGPMHVATGLGLKCVVIINFPEPNTIFLPTLAVTGQVEEEWFYPQHVHLHQDGEGALVKRATLDNLKRAFDGGVYPFWSDKYLPLIHEAL